MSSGNEPKPFRGNVLYSRKLEATEPLYGDLNRIGTVQIKSAAPARSRRNARSRTEAFSSWYGVNTQMPAEMTALATRAAIPTQLAAGARGRGAIVHARDLRMASSDLRSVASSNYWRQGVGVIGPGLAVAAKVSGALASRGSGSGRPNATKSFERPIGPRLGQVFPMPNWKCSSASTSSFIRASSSDRSIIWIWTRCLEQSDWKVAITPRS